MHGRHLQYLLLTFKINVFSFNFRNYLIMNNLRCMFCFLENYQIV